MESMSRNRKIVGVGVAVVLGALGYGVFGVDEKIILEMEEIAFETKVEQIQSEYFEKNSKYERIKPTEIIDKIGIDNDEVTDIQIYDGPYGKGYAIVEYKEVVNKDGDTRVARKSTGYGPEAETWTFDWYYSELEYQSEDKKDIKLQEDGEIYEIIK